MSVWAGRSFGTLLCEKNSVSVCKFCEVSRKSSKNKPKARSTLGTVFPDSSFSVKHWRLKQGDIQDEVTANEVFPSVAHSHAHYHKHLSKHNNDHVTLQVISCVLLFPLGVVIFHFECVRVLRGVTVCRREREREGERWQTGSSFLLSVSSLKCIHGTLIFFFQNAHQTWQGIKRITAWKLLRAGDHSWAEAARSW